MERPAWAPPGIDTSMPSVSRMHDYYLGGSHNFEIDREAARRALEFLPGLPRIMQAGRAFMRRAVRYAIGRGVTQFLDIGSGIPTFGSVHEVARAAHPGARIVCADHDPIAVAHGRSLTESDPLTAFTAGDLRKPRQILDSPEVTGVLDLEQPVALLLVSVLHFTEDADDPYGAVAEVSGPLAPGSLIVINHMAHDGLPVSEAEAAPAIDVYQDIRNPLIMRSHAQTARFFEGYEMVEPGLVSPPRWRPDTPAEQEDAYASTGFAGVGHKA
ncbi:SAM-dependent methyltransferase [Streptomyces sp. CAU 1734]|uniref:SAM-dependent methyltransferase n=1 Tax=Streptomyces sp. CAU 1734 TaxID=3140360 RepID=UPI0032603784